MRQISNSLAMTETSAVLNVLVGYRRPRGAVASPSDEGLLKVGQYSCRFKSDLDGRLPDTGLRYRFEIGVAN